MYGVDNSKIDDILKDERNQPYAQPPIERSLLFGSSEFSNPRVYFKSEEPISLLEAEFDWVVKRKNVRMALLGTFTILLAVIQIELAYDAEEYMYNVGSLRGRIIKGLQSFFDDRALVYDLGLLRLPSNWHQEELVCAAVQWKAPWELAPRHPLLPSMACIHYRAGSSLHPRATRGRLSILDSSRGQDKRQSWSKEAVHQRQAASVHVPAAVPVDSGDSGLLQHLRAPSTRILGRVSGPWWCGD